MSLKFSIIFNYFAFNSRDGNFAVKRSKGRFNEIPTDQCIEQTINRQQKCHGGIVGSSTSEGTVQRWVLTSHVSSKIISNLESDFNLKTTTQKPKDLLASRRAIDNGAVNRAYDVLENWGNPFDARSYLINICSGKETTQDIQKDLITAESVGESCLQSFINDRLKTSKISFYDPIKKLKLKSFSDLKVKSTIKLNSKTLSIAAERSMFGRLLVIAQSRDSLTLKQIFNYSLSPIPWALGMPDGGLVKTPKSKLLGSYELFKTIFETELFHKL